MRKLIGVTIFGIAVVAIRTAPAMAKSPRGDEAVTTGVTVAGPRLPGPLSLTGSDAAAYGTLTGAFKATRFPHAPRIALGPRFRVTETIRCAEAPTIVVRQDVFPYATYGPW